MLDFLPQNNRKAIISEYLLRIFVILFFLIFASTLLLIALFLPSFFFSQYKDQTITEEAQFVNTTDGASYDSAASVVKNVNAMAKTLAPDPNGNTFATDLIEKITALKSSDITISQIELVSDPSANAEDVTLTGVSVSRDSLTAFYNALKANASFQNVTLPVSSLIADAGNPFTITLSSPIQTNP